MDENLRAREYQIELVDKALRENGIIFMPTGSGKTFVASLLIKELATNSLELKYTEGGKRTFFLVNTVQLVSQQAEAVEAHTQFSVGRFSGDMNVDYWTMEKWHKELDKYEVLVMTAQIFLNLILHSFLDFQSLNLLILDECHHARQNHAMKQIMTLYKEYNGPKPHILGLTATLLNANCVVGKIDEEIASLSSTMNSKVLIPSNDELVKKFSTSPIEVVVWYDQSHQFKRDIEDILKPTVDHLYHLLTIIQLPDRTPVPVDLIENAKLINKKKSWEKAIGNMLTQITELAGALGPFAASKTLLALLVRFERMKLNAEEPIVYHLLNTFVTKLHYLRKCLEDLMKTVSPGEQPIVFSSPKLKKLFEIIRTMKKSDSVLVFVKLRFTAKVLFYILQHLAANNESYSHVTPDFIVGYNNNPLNDVKELMFEKKLNSGAMNRFNSKITNLLFASNVIEEGTDIQHCNSVVKFDAIDTFRAYVQSKGRARHKDSKYYIFCEDQKEYQKYESFLSMENTITKLLLRSVGNPRPMEFVSDPVEPFAPFGSDGPKITVYSAISLLNRYTSMLPQDKYAMLTTYWWSRINPQGKTCAILQLPINSALKDPVEGVYCNNEMDAKRVAALFACKRLFELGELDSKLLPRGRDNDVLYDTDLFKLWPTLSEPKDGPKSGTSRKVRMYKMRCPPWLIDCQPKTGTKLYVHLFSMNPIFDTEGNNRLNVFKNHLSSNLDFAMLSSKRIPKVCDFPLFMNVGEVVVKIKENCFTVVLTIEELKLLNEFHTMLFTQVLNVANKFLVRDYKRTENSYLIVPVLSNATNNGGVIDWNTVKTYKEIPKSNPVPMKDRTALNIRGSDYENKIIIPWYRPGGVTRLRYIVTKVREDLSPASSFPSDNYSTYEDYFEKRYDERVANKSQPLIEVRAISSKINCIKPRGYLVSGVRKKKMDDDFEETLIPELCVLVEFPASYMLKATVLPSLLHRLKHLLCAEEMRQTIVKEVGLGKMNSEGEWKTLEVDSNSLQNEEEPASQSTILVSDMLNENMEALKPNIYPWRPEEEPCDIERSGNSVDLLSVIHYNKFVSSTTSGSALFKELYPTLSEIPNCIQHGTCNYNYDSMGIPINIRKPCVNSKTTSNIHGTNGYSNRQKKKININGVSLGVIELGMNDESIGPELAEILPVLTPMRANDIINYERLETLGDSFLKFAVSLSLFVNFPHYDEGKLTLIKGKVVGNRNLFYVGNNFKMGERLKAHDFSADEWEVPGFTVVHPVNLIITQQKISPAPFFNIELTPKEIHSGLANAETLQKVLDILSNLKDAKDNPNAQPNNYGLHYVGHQTSSDKVVADSVEALIGVYLQCCGIRSAFKLCTYLNILPPKYADIKALLVDPAPSALRKSTMSYKHLIKANVIEETIGYKFKDQSFLLQAFTHSSACHYATECYQRLEFLGDALLDFLITLHIYQEGGQLSPGELTDLRSALVNNVTLSCLAVKYDFHKYLISRAYALTEIISVFACDQAKRGHSIGPEVLFLMSEGDVDVAESIVVPKVLGDLFESIVAAVYLDSGKCLKTTWKVIYRLMHKEIREFSRNIPKNHIRLLYEKFPKPSPVFGKSRVDDDGRVLVPLEVTFNVQSSPERKIFVGVGLTKSSAKFAAAKVALRYFHNIQN